MVMDNLDRRILDFLQRDNKSDAIQIGKAVGLESSAVRRRIGRLREVKAIHADVAILDPGIVGRRTTFVVDITLARDRIDLIDAFKRQMRAIPEVQQCYDVVGEVDFILIFTAATIPDFEELTRKLFVGNPIIRGWRTSVVKDRVKVGLAIPMTTHCSNAK